MYINTKQNERFLVWAFPMSIIALAIVVVIGHLLMPTGYVSAAIVKMGSEEFSDLADYIIFESESASESEPEIDLELQLALNLSYQLESECGVNLVSSNGRDIGPLQIQTVVIEDINRILGYNAYVAEDRWNLEKSCEIFWIYLTYYGEVYHRRTGKNPTVETYLRMWNKGPNGWKKPESLFHWEKAKKLIKG